MAHLATLEQEGIIETWHTGEVFPGAESKKEIQRNLYEAQIVLLLISPQFLASSDFEDLMTSVLRLHGKGKTKVIPILLRPANWRITPLGKLKVLPEDSNPITTWINQDEAFLSIVQELKKIIDSLRYSGKTDVFPSVNDLDVLVKTAQEYCRKKISNQHSEMKLLSGRKIRIDQLYVDVYLLDRPEKRLYIPQEILLKNFDIRNDRFALSRRIGERIPGIQLAKLEAKLLILGKPGSGKTTFLKHIALDWSKGKFQPDFIAVMIEFRKVSDDNWDLIKLIHSEIEVISVQQLISLLQRGKLLVLMDGLDEIPTEGLRRSIQKQLQKLVEEYPENRFALTCRTQILEVIPERFSSVEVADFSLKQVENFVRNWFDSIGKSKIEAGQVWYRFCQVMEKNLALKELTLTPVLLSLMCLVLEDSGEIPENKTYLYKRGIRLLLEQWNDEKFIDTWEMGSEVYQGLSVDKKESLLVEIAAQKFNNPKNFVLFEQQDIACQISEFLNLSSYREGVSVLRAIEAQHGLLIERADELWSFSHLTFQEHFTLQWLAKLTPEQLAMKISDQQWRNVVKQLIKSQQPADQLLRLIKRATDCSVVNDVKIKNFLNWVFQKTNSFSKYKPAAIRAFYFSLSFGYSLELSFSLDSRLKEDIVLNQHLDEFGSSDYELKINMTRDRDKSLDLTYARKLDRDLVMTNLLRQGLNLSINKIPNRSHLSDLYSNLKSTYNTALELNVILGDDSKNQLKSLDALLPKLPVMVDENFSKGVDSWVDELRKIMVNVLDIGHEYNFDEEQMDQINRYYENNQFIFELIKIEGAASNDVRDFIEEALLLINDE